MRVVVIGATGHIGTYLIPRLVDGGHEVVAVSRGQRNPYKESAAWKSVSRVTMDRESLEREGTFGEAVRDLKPDVVIDLVCFTLPSAEQLVRALRGRVQHFLHCGTIWVHGPSVSVPTEETQARRPFGSYGVQKAEIEAFLLQEARLGNLPCTVLHPGHIVGPGWAPLNPAGHFNPTVFSKLAHGEELVLPNFGMETVHHVHADDVAAAFQQALGHFSTSVGESFHVVSPAAVSLRGYAQEVCAWFGKEANLTFVSWQEFLSTVSEAEGKATWDHIAHSPNVSIDKAKRMIQYQPRYSSFAAVKEAVEWMIDSGEIHI